MKQIVIAFFALILSLPAWSANVAPLGVEIGVADLETVKSKIGSQTRLNDAGINKWTGGAMLTSDGDGLDIEELQEATFIFGQDGKLDGLIMQMGKQRLKDVAAVLRKKYKVVRENFPFVGDASATYRQGASLVRLEAPHLSFSMQVLYLSNRLDSAFNRGSAVEEAERKGRQAEKF